MTTLDFLASEVAVANRRSLFGGLKAMWLRHKRRRETTRTIIELSRLDAHLLRDMGIEPLDIHDALNDRRRSVLLNPMRRPDHE